MTSLHLQKIPLPWLSSDDPEVCAQVARAIENAFGPGGPGLLLIDQLGETYARDRQRLLRAGHALGTLTPAQLSNLEFPEVDYSVGWSRGREIFKGVPDSRKGSFYANPVHDDPALGDESLAHKYPYVLPLARFLQINCLLLRGHTSFSNIAFFSCMLMQ